MTADDNLRPVQQQFEAFGRGDIDVALASVADDVDWHAAVSAHASPLLWPGAAGPTASRRLLPPAHLGGAAHGHSRT